MTERRKKNQRQEADFRASSALEASENRPPEDDIQFEPEFLERVSGIALSGISAASALDLMAKLLTEIPTASKGAIDKIKVMDKVINSARQMLETKVKTEDVPAIMKRLDEMEAEMDKLL